MPKPSEDFLNFIVEVAAYKGEVSVEEIDPASIVIKELSADNIEIEFAVRDKWSRMLRNKALKDDE